MRLVSGDGGSDSGQLQVFLPDGNWASVCHDSSTWSQVHASVACRELGYQQLLQSTGKIKPASITNLVDFAIQEQNLVSIKPGLVSMNYNIITGLVYITGLVSSV